MRFSRIMASLLVFLGLLVGVVEAKGLADERTTILKFGGSVEGKTLSKVANNAQRAATLSHLQIDVLGVDSISPLFPIPPAGVRDSSAYDSLGLGQFFIAHLSSGTTPTEILQSVGALSAVERMELNHLHYAQEPSVAPNDPLYTLQWSYPLMDLPQAWNVTQGSSDIVVGVIDSGLDFLHPDIDFGSRIAINVSEYNGLDGIDDDLNGLIDDVFGYDFINGDGLPLDDNSHGTHVSATIGAATNNSTGVAGVDWQSLIFSCKVLGADGAGPTSAITSAIYYCTNMGCHILNISIGGPGSSAYEAALNYAYLNHVAVIGQWEMRIPLRQAIRPCGRRRWRWARRARTTKDGFLLPRQARITGATSE